MNNVLKNNHGVTIVMLVITVIILLMLTAFAVFYSNNIAPEARVAAAYSSLKEIKDRCEGAVADVEERPEQYDEFYFFGKTITREVADGIITQSELDDYAIKCGLSDASEFGERTYRITPGEDQSVKARIKALELSSISGSYIVDLDNDKYYIVGGVKRKTGDFFYEYKDIQRMYEMLTKSENM